MVLAWVAAAPVARAGEVAVPGPAATGVRLSPSSITAPPPRMRVLFLRADFPDHPATRPTADFHNPAGTGLIDRMVAYYREVSSGRLTIDPVISDPVWRLSKPRASYRQASLETIRETVALASRKSPEGDPLVAAGKPYDAVVVSFAGPGAESDIARKSTDNPWSEAVIGIPSLLAGGASGGLVLGEDPYPPLSPFGVLCHEFGHVLALPELYAPNKPHEGIGIWGLMGQGTWVGRGDVPPHLCAWSKLALGWVDPILVTKTQRVTLPSVQRSAQVVKIWATDESNPQEYFLIENREKRGADRGIPGPGLLVWHVDESRNEFRRSQDDAAHKRVDLLTADSWPSHLDVGHAAGGNRGDAGDAWHSRAEGIGPDTKPSTAPYDGSRGRFRLANVSPPGEVMTFDVIFGDDPAPVTQPAGTPPTGAKPSPALTR